MHVKYIIILIILLSPNITTATEVVNQIEIDRSYIRSITVPGTLDAPESFKTFTAYFDLILHINGEESPFPEFYVDIEVKFLGSSDISNKNDNYKIIFAIYENDKFDYVLDIREAEIFSIILNDDTEVEFHQDGDIKSIIGLPDEDREYRIEGTYKADAPYNGRPLLTYTLVLIISLVALFYIAKMGNLFGLDTKIKRWQTKSRVTSSKKGFTPTRHKSTNRARKVDEGKSKIINYSSTPVKPDKNDTCPSCGSVGLLGNKICLKCGYKESEMVKYDHLQNCCKMAYRLKDKYCGDCGRVINYG